MNSTIQDLYESNCSFGKGCQPGFKIRKYQSGITQCKTQCEKCGNSFGQPISRKNIDPAIIISPFNEAKYQECLESIHRPELELNEKQQRLIEIRRNIKRDYFQNKLQIEYVNAESFYTEYLASSFWQEKRQIILKRDNYMCRYCENHKASQVHHLSYVNLGNESEFELISVCYSCHQIIHDIVINEPIWDSVKKRYL